MKKDRNILITLAASVALVSVVLGLLKFSGYNEHVFRFLEWVRDSGKPGQMVFFIAVLLTVVLLLPAVVLTMSAGYLYGVVGGSITIVLQKHLVRSWLSWPLGTCRTAMSSDSCSIETFWKNGKTLSFHAVGV